MGQEIGKEIEGCATKKIRAYEIWIKEKSSLLKHASFKNEIVIPSTLHNDFKWENQVIPLINACILF